MNRWSLGFAAAAGLMTPLVDVTQAQVFYAYEAPKLYAAPVYRAPVYAAPAYVPSVTYQPQVFVPARAVVSTGYARPYVYSAPVVVHQPVVQMAYSSPMIVPARTVVAAPVIVASPTTVVESTRASRHNFTQTVRVYGPTDGPHYSRVHVHSGLFGTTIRERVW